MTGFQIAFDRPWPSSADFSSAEVVDPRFVGERERTWLIPTIHQTISAPGCRHSWPMFSEATPAHHAGAYWEAAVYLLACMLGWTDLGAGLQRFYQDPPAPGLSPELDLLREVWNDHGQLDLLALWAWQRNHRVDSRQPAFVEGLPDRPPERFLGADWYREFLRRFPHYGAVYEIDPYHGGSNPLHLGHALGAFARDDGHEDAVVYRSGHRQAVLVLNRCRGWIHALESLTAGLPQIATRVWRVEVVVRPCGWLGTFRRSRATNRWFAGKQFVHDMGCPSE